MSSTQVSSTILGKAPNYIGCIDDRAFGLRLGLKLGQFRECEAVVFAYSVRVQFPHQRTGHLGPRVLTLFAGQAGCFLVRLQAKGKTSLPDDGHLVHTLKQCRDQKEKRRSGFGQNRSYAAVRFPPWAGRLAYGAYRRCRLVSPVKVSVRLGSSRE